MLTITPPMRFLPSTIVFDINDSYTPFKCNSGHTFLVNIVFISPDTKQMHKLLSSISFNLCSLALTHLPMPGTSKTGLRQVKIMKEFV
jgi:hypothetical protein